MTMAMEAMEGGGKALNKTVGQYSTGKGGGKGSGKSDGKFTTAGNQEALLAIASTRKSRIASALVV